MALFLQGQKACWAPSWELDPPLWGRLWQAPGPTPPPPPGRTDFLCSENFWVPTKRVLLGPSQPGPSVCSPKPSEQGWKLNLSSAPPPPENTVDCFGVYFK